MARSIPGATVVCTPVLTVRQVTRIVGIAAGRVLRRWYPLQGLTKQARWPRVDQSTGRAIYPSATMRKRLFRDNRGFVTVTDYTPPRTAYQSRRGLPTNAHAHADERIVGRERVGGARTPCQPAGSGRLRPYCTEPSTWCIGVPNPCARFVRG
jgi:hypothetical protein